MAEKKVSVADILISVAVLVVVGIISVNLMVSYNKYPLGSDVYGHLFKIREIYNSVNQGIWYPIYSPNWYNGIELFRYWPAASYYFYTLFMLITEGNIYSSFLLFTFAVFAIGGMGWILFGIREKQIWISLAIGCLYFYLPDNMRVFFSEGNIPRIFINCLIPYVFYFLTDIIYYKKKSSVIYLNVVITVIVCSHIMISAMLGIAIFIYLFIDALVNKTFKRQIIALIDAILAFINAGIILLPGLTGGLLSQNSASSQDTSSTWSQELYKSFNPFNRMSNFDMFYFGLSILIICVLGLIVVRKKTIPGFLTCLIIFIGTSTFAAKIISLMPFSQALWMSRFVPIAMVVFFIGLLGWNELKPVVRILFFVFIAVDCLLSVAAISWKDITIEEKQVKMQDEYYLKDAFDIVDNKVALMDLSELGSYPTLYSSERGTGNYLFGWAYQGANNIESIVALNESFENGHFVYMFDRLVEYGCDTVIIKKDCIKIGSLEELDNAAKLLGYSLVNENKYAILYKLEVEGQYGTINKYRNVAIGQGANDICYIYPSFYKLSNDYLDDYSFEYLSQFENIYLSRFQYKDIEASEALVNQLAENGTKIFIDMNGIPEDKSRGRNHFLGAYAQNVAFTDVFPIIENNNGHQFKLGSGNKNYDVWRTTYITDAPTVIKSSEYKPGRYLNYLAKGESESVTLIGLNLVYYYTENGGVDLKNFLDETFEISDSELIERSIYPINIEYGYDKVVFNSSIDGLNTNVSALDCFRGNFSTDNKVIVVDSGQTIVTLEYTLFKEGLMVSIIGYMLTAILIVVIFWKGVLDEAKIVEDNSVIDSGSVSELPNDSNGQ